MAEAVPGQADLIRRDVADQDVADVGPGVERRGGQRQHHDAVPGRDVLQLLLHGPEERDPPRRLPVPELNRDITPLGHRLRVLEEMLGGQVGH